MQKYKLSREDIDEPYEIDAGNKREAQRRFDALHGHNPDLVTGVEIIPGIVKAEGEPEGPAKHLYRVTWGDEVAEVSAVHHDDAWSQFVGNDTSSLKWRYPHLHERIIECLDEEQDEDAEEGTSPVQDLSASEARDKISRMHSVDKLKAIAQHDTRSSVQADAQARLTEIGGS